MSNPKTENQSSAANPNSRITSLSTLRALQKAAKQLAPSRTESDDSQKKVEANKEKKSPREKTPPSTRKGKLPKAPDDINAYELRQAFQTALSKLYTNETKE